MANLTLYTKALSFDDPTPNNNPQLRVFDWTRQNQGLVVSNPNSNIYSVDPLATLNVFSGLKTTTIDGTTQFALTILSSNRYRLAHTGTGTAPGFRTDRNLTLTGGSAIITPQINQSVVLTHSAGAVFAAVQVGDIVYIPGVSTYDTGPFDFLNEGEWSVLTASSTALNLVRLPGTVYQAKGETVLLSSNTQVQAYSSTGVQVDDVLQLKATFPSSVIRSYEIVQVTAKAVEFLSSQILPAITTIVPGATGVVVFSEAKQWLGIETNQEIDLFINGSATGVPVEPWLAGDDNRKGRFENSGTIFSLSITNKTTSTASVRIFSAE